MKEGLHKFIDRGVRAVGIALILGGGGYLYHQNQELSAQVQQYQGKLNTVGRELFESDAILCDQADFLSQATGGPGIDCATSMKKELQRFQDAGVDAAPLVTPTPVPPNTQFD